jgi:hypothetical protein
VAFTKVADAMLEQASKIERARMQRESGNLSVKNERTNGLRHHASCHAQDARWFQDDFSRESYCKKSNSTEERNVIGILRVHMWKFRVTRCATTSATAST